MPVLTAFAASPDRGRGHARDFRVRWALEETGVTSDMRYLSFAEMKEPEHLARHPFGQIPTWEERGLTLFESGAIVLRIAQTKPGLLPDDEAARLRAIEWLFAALNTLEPPIVEREAAMLTEREAPWFEERDAMLARRIETRFDALARRLGDAEWLDGAFSVGDLVMVTVLRRPAGAALLDAFPPLAAYVARGEARPAYRRAFDAQQRVFLEGPPKN
jgi:glutathione S-transferase